MGDKPEITLNAQEIASINKVIGILYLINTGLRSFAESLPENRGPMGVVESFSIVNSIETGRKLSAKLRPEAMLTEGDIKNIQQLKSEALSDLGEVKDYVTDRTLRPSAVNRGMREREVGQAMEALEAMCKMLSSKIPSVAMEDSPATDLTR